MKFVQYYLDCLSQASYLIGDGEAGVAAVVDPRRDIDEYLADAAEAGLSIAYVIETHVHADFLSGHLELAAATGAEIVFGAAAQADFPIRRVHDGERLALGDVQLELRETPGHTPESISVVVYEHAGDTEPYAVLTGDTLFIGDVGRPDLLASAGLSADELARKLYRSLHDRLLDLPDETRVFPAHGAGSACGKQLSTSRMSTIGEQRRTNYALQPMTEDQFVALVTVDQPPAPSYFAHDSALNRSAHPLFGTEPPAPMDLGAVLATQGAGTVVVDTRDAPAFAAGHLRGSVNVGLDGRYAEHAGAVLDPHADLVLVAEPGDEDEARTRLARVGFDRVIGFLGGGPAVLAERPDVVRRASRLTAAQLDDRLRGVEGLQVVDVRNPGETAAGMIPGAAAVPLAALGKRIGELDLARPVVVYCAGGHRSSIAASVLRAAGAADVSDLLGGYGAWVAAHAPAGHAPAAG